jgi:phosphotriesterase-related protein
MSITRREFLYLAAGAFSGFGFRRAEFNIQTINGLISPDRLGTTLIHEHFLVDFIGADKTNSNRWDRKKVVSKVLPYLKEVRQAGVKSIFDCTPAFLGRDPELLLMLAQESGLQLITNTGYYGAVENKYLPPWAFTESAEQLSKRWIKEFEIGIDGTSIKPGFIKISVDAGPLSELHKKIVRAAAQTHLKTGLTICSHTGPAVPALKQLELLQAERVDPSAFVWVHAQNESDSSHYLKAAKQGAWISLDGIGWGKFDEQVNSISLMKANNLLHRVLVSNDAGWYKPDEPEGKFQGYMNIFTELIPRLKAKGFTPGDIDQLLIRNPAEAFALRVRN